MRFFERDTPFLITLRGCLTVAWMSLSTGLYSPLCLVLAPFSRRGAYAVGKMWCRQVLSLAGSRLEVTGLEKLDPKKKYTFLSNHQSQLDILALMTSAPLQLAFLAKKELFDLPFFGWGLRALGHIPIDRRNNRKALDAFSEAARRLREDREVSLVIFPEGTRSEDGKILEFKQGSFTLVLQAGLPVVPVAIQGSRDALPKGSVMALPGVIKITYGEPFDLSGFQLTEKARLSHQVRETILRMMGQTAG